jgi:hypothetical protein
VITTSFGLATELENLMNLGQRDEPFLQAFFRVPGKQTAA